VRVQKVDERWEIELVDHWMPRLSINPERLRLLKSRLLTGDLKKHVRRGIENARFLIESIEQRRRTLERVAHEIIKRQQDYLEHGIEHLKPLKMQEIADELGIHVSTVSRALKGKYIQTPQGIHEMKAFFTGASQGTDGVVESRTGVRERVRELVEKEDKANPLSDEEIVEKLKAMGLNIARRTVTKYRKALKIPSSRQRREY
jgi:RNA polymerase sigma-54 factor